MNTTLKNIYEAHHAMHRGADFSILKSERGGLIKNYIGTGKIILDVGCRDGALTSFFSEGNTVLGVDIDERALARARDLLRIETQVVDLNSDWNELGARKFDVIVAGEILEHVYYPEEIVIKVKERLNPGGLFLGSVPNAFNLKNRLRYLAGSKKHTPLSDPTHINHFTYNELLALLTKNFSQVQVSGLGRWKTLARIFPNLCSFDLFFIAHL